MENYQYKVQLGQHKARIEKEVEALQRALHATGSQVRSLVISVDSLNGQGALQKLLESPCLSRLEHLALKLDFSLGATSLGILAKAAEDRHLPWLLHLSISYQGDKHQRKRPRSSCSSRRSRSTISHSQFTSSSSGGMPGAHSPSSSSSTWRNQTSTFQDGNSSQGVPVSWEGFALLAGVLRENLLPRLEKTVSLSSNWRSLNLGDVGVKYLAELIGTGYLAGLKELDLEENSIGSAGMEALAGAFGGRGNMVALQVLNLNQNIFNPSGTGVMKVVKVMEAGHLPSLKRIGLAGAGHQAIPNGVSVADEIVAAFTRNTSLTADVQMDWPDKRLQRRWKAVWERNLKRTRILQKLVRQEEDPVTNGTIVICGFPVRRSRFGAFIRKERQLRQKNPPPAN